MFASGVAGKYTGEESSEALAADPTDLVEVHVRAHGRAAAGVVLEVIVGRGAGGVPGVPDEPDDLTGLNVLAVHPDMLGEVGVVHVVGVDVGVHVHRDPPEAVVALLGPAGERRPDRRAGRGEDVVALVGVPDPGEAEVVDVGTRRVDRAPGERAGGRARRPSRPATGDPELGLE